MPFNHETDQFLVGIAELSTHHWYGNKGEDSRINSMDDPSRYVDYYKEDNLIEVRSGKTVLVVIQNFEAWASDQIIANIIDATFE